MTRLATVSLALLAAAPLAAAAAPPPPTEDAPELAAEVDFASRYLWRGLPFSDGFVMQPWLAMSIGNVELSLFSSMPLQREAGRGRFTELDPAVTAAFEAGDFTFTPGLQGYVFLELDDAPPTGELSFQAAWAFHPGLTLSTSHAVDVATYAGAYYGDLALAWEREVGSRVAVSLSARLGWGSDRFHDAYAGCRRWAATQVGADASLEVRVAGPLRLRPHAGIVVLPDRALREAVGRTVLFVYGVVLGV